MSNFRENALTFLHNLVGCCFRYGLKSYNMDFFDFGFGEDVHFINCFGNAQIACQYTLHFTCGIKLFWKDGHTNIYDNAEHDIFSADIEPLIGTKVSRIALSEKNDLWIDLGLCNMVVVTYEDNKESWRFFLPGADRPHLIATGQDLYFE